MWFLVSRRCRNFQKEKLRNFSQQYEKSFVLFQQLKGYNRRDTAWWMYRVDSSKASLCQRKSCLTTEESGNYLDMRWILNLVSLSSRALLHHIDRKFSDRKLCHAISVWACVAKDVQENDNFSIVKFYIIWDESSVTPVVTFCSRWSKSLDWNFQRE